MTDRLNDKQRRFVQEYMIDLNATQAAIRAGYSEKTAGSQSFDLLQKPEIQDAISQAKSERASETKIDAAWVLKRLAAEADADVADLYDEDGRLLPVNRWPKIWRQGLVAGLKTQVSEDGVAIIDVKLSDRVRRLELIGKHIGVNAFQEIVQHKGLEGLADRLDRASKRGD
jgi:phage terminase small subunit